MKDDVDDEDEESVKVEGASSKNYKKKNILK